MVENPSGLSVTKNASPLLKKQSWWPDDWAAAAEEVEVGYWVKRQRGQHKHAWEKVHNIPRETLYRPCIANNDPSEPAGEEDIGKFRNTLGQYQDGKPFYKLDCCKYKDNN